MRTRQNIGVGGLYPTGRSSTVLDFQDTSRAISERLIKREQERIGQEKQYMQESEKAILDALSYEAVIGASDAMQLKHLENVNNTQDKWAQIYAASDGKLSITQLAELQKEKRKVESERVNMQTNVKNFELVQRELLSDPQAEKWDKTSFDKFQQNVNAGKVGDPTVDWLDVLTPRQRDLSEMLDKEFKNYKQSAITNIDKTGYTVNPDGTITWNENNKRVLQSSFDALFNSRAGQGKFMEYGGTPEAKVRMQNEFRESVIRDMQLGQFSAPAQRNLMQGQGIDNEYTRKYPQLRGLSKTHTDTAVYLNDIAEGALQLDEDVVKLLSRQPLSSFGVPANVSIQRVNGKDYIVWRNQQTNAQLKSLEIPENRKGNEEAIKKFKVELLADYKAIAGKDKPGGTDWVIPNWGEFKTSGRAARPAQVTTIERLLDDGNKDSIAKGADKDKDYIDIVADRIGKLIPGIEIKKTTGWGKRRITITAPNEDTETFNLKEESGRRALKDYISRKVNWDERVQTLMPEGVAEQAAPGGLTPEQESIIDMLLAKPENEGWTREEIIEHLGY
jgi:hypothetical protein